MNILEYKFQVRTDKYDNEMGKKVIEEIDNIKNYYNQAKKEFEAYNLVTFDQFSLEYDKIDQFY